MWASANDATTYALVPLNGDAGDVLTRDSTYFTDYSWKNPVTSLSGGYVSAGSIFTGYLTVEIITYQNALFGFLKKTPDTFSTEYSISGTSSANAILRIRLNNLIDYCMFSASATTLYHGYLQAATATGAYSRSNLRYNSTTTWANTITANSAVTQNTPGTSMREGQSASATSYSLRYLWVAPQNGGIENIYKIENQMLDIHNGSLRIERLA
jgi:hypothetical protein